MCIVMGLICVPLQVVHTPADWHIIMPGQLPGYSYTPFVSDLFVLKSSSPTAWDVAGHEGVP